MERLVRDELPGDVVSDLLNGFSDGVMKRVDKLAADGELRQGDDPEAIKREIEEIIQNITIVRTGPKRAYETFEQKGVYKEQTEKLNTLGIEFDALDEKDREHKGCIFEWSDIVEAIPNIPDFLAGVDSLTDARIFFLNKEGRLVMGDNFINLSEEMKNLTYFQARHNAARVSYVEDDKIIVAHGNNIVLPEGIKILSKTGLISKEDAIRVADSVFESQPEFDCVGFDFESTHTVFFWTEAGKIPDKRVEIITVSWELSAYDGVITLDKTQSTTMPPTTYNHDTCRTIKINLDLEKLSNKHNPRTKQENIDPPKKPEDIWGNIKFATWEDRVAWENSRAASEGDKYHSKKMQIMKLVPPIVEE